MLTLSLFQLALLGTGAALGRVGRLRSVPEPVDHARQPARGGGDEHRQVARTHLAVVGDARDPAVQRRRPVLSHARPT